MQLLEPEIAITTLSLLKMSAKSVEVYLNSELAASRIRTLVLEGSHQIEVLLNLALAEVRSRKGHFKAAHRLLLSLKSK